MRASSRYYIFVAIVASLVVSANFPAFADTYHTANFSGAINSGSANCKAPFNTIISQGGPVSGNLVYDDDKIPAPGSGSVNVSFSSFPDIAQIPAAIAFTIDLGATVLTFTLADAIQNSGAVQYKDGQFVGFFFAADFTFSGSPYRFRDNGSSWDIRLLNQLGGSPVSGITPFVTGKINPGLTDVQPFEPSSAVPIPSAILLLGSGLAGLAGWRRFRKI